VFTDVKRTLAVLELQVFVEENSTPRPPRFSSGYLREFPWTSRPRRIRRRWNEALKSVLTTWKKTFAPLLHPAAP
jgi:hypothetical protein